MKRAFNYMVVKNNYKITTPAQVQDIKDSIKTAYKDHIYEIQADRNYIDNLKDEVEGNFV